MTVYLHKKGGAESGSAKDPLQDAVKIEMIFSIKIS